MKVGLVLGGGMAPSEVVVLSKAAEDAGLDSFWVTEGAGGDAFALLAAVAISTSRVRLGTAVVNVYSRSPSVIGMAALTLNELSAGRFILGLGSSHDEQVEIEHGIRRDRPLQHLADTLEVVRRLDSVSEVRNVREPTVQIGRFQLNFNRQQSDLKIYIAAIGPQTTDLAVSRADGVMVVWRTPAEVAELHRAFPNAHIVGVLHCTVGEDERASGEALVAARARHSRFANYRGFFKTQRSPAGIAGTSSARMIKALQSYQRAGLNEALMLPVPMVDKDPYTAGRLLVDMVRAAPGALGGPAT